MTESSHHQITERANRIITEKFGISFTPENLHNLQKLLVNTARELGFHKDIGLLTNLIERNNLTPTQSEILISNLTIGETFFFRDMLTLDTVRDHILKPLIESRRDSARSLRLWSAACCSGEEPYTLAIMLRELIPDIKNWDIKILATDLNSQFLEKAKKGIYTAWSFRNTHHEITKKYFLKKGNALELIPEVRNMVTFLPLNLVGDRSVSANHSLFHQDVIFCRNVLMYFAPDQAIKVSESLFSSLNEHGWLVISPVESSIQVYSAFRTVMMNGITLYQKTSLQTKSMAGPLPKRNYSIKSPDSFQDPATLKKIPGLKEKKSVAIKPKEVSTYRSTVTKPAPEQVFNVMAEFNKGNYLQVIEFILKKKNSGSVGKELISLLARSYANLGQLQLARELMDDLIKLDQTEASSHYFQATILQEMNLLEEAEETLRRAVYLEPGHLLSHFLLGNLSGRLGKQSKARKHYLNARELLAKHKDEEVLPESEGMTAGRLKEIINSMI